MNTVKQYGVGGWDEVAIHTYIGMLTGGINTRMCGTLHRNFTDLLGCRSIDPQLFSGQSSAVAHVILQQAYIAVHVLFQNCSHT